MARAGSQTPFPWGSSSNGDKANVNAFSFVTNKGRYLGVTVDAKSYDANGFGLFDTSGNVSEWCSDWYGEDYYELSRVKDPEGPLGGYFRVYRGGSWQNLPGDARSASRGTSTPGNASAAIAFRVVAE